MRKIKQILSLVLSVSLIASYAPNVALADNEGSNDVKEVKVNVSAQANYAFIVPNQTITVAADAAESYGYTDDQGASGDVTALDVLVCATKIAYGDLFSEETKDDYLVVDKSDYGYSISTLFGEETYNVGFFINGKQPHDDVLIPSDWGDYYTGYTVGDALVNTGDDVEFVIYQDKYAMDLKVNATYNNKDLNYATIAAGEEIEVETTGYWIGYYGCNTDEFIESQTMSVEDVQYAILDDYGNYELIDNAITDEDGITSLKFDTPGKYKITAVGTSEYSYILMPYFEINVVDEVEPTIKDDIYLQYDFKELSIGESARIYPRRVEQIIKNDTAGVAYVVRPRFDFEIVSGDSVKLSKNYSTDGTYVEAVKAGTTIVKVTYDSCFAYGKTHASIFEANTAYVVFDVPANDSDITIDSGIDFTSYDTVYFVEGDSTDFTFTPTVTGAESFEVTVNGEVVNGTDGAYTAKLENRDNIIGIVATDSDGNTKSFYQTVAARKIEINVVDVTSDNFETGDEIQISFSGITLPVYKLAGIYNPSSYMPAWGGKASFVSYTLDNYEGVTYIDGAGKTVECSDGEVKGYGKQYDITNYNTITLTFAEGGEYNLSLGRIFESWWGSGLGADKLVENGGKPNLNAPVLEDYFDTLPDIKIQISESDAKKIERLEKELKELQSKYDELKDTYDEVKEAYDELKESDDSLKAELERLSKELKDASDELESTKTELENTKKELEDAKAALEEATKEPENTGDEHTGNENTDTSEDDGKGSDVSNDNSKEILKNVVNVASSKVKGFKVKKSGKKAKLSWKKVEGATGYLVYRKAGKGKFKLIKTLTGEDKVKFTNKKLKKKTYKYKVVAFIEVDGKKVLSKSSKVRKIKIKK